jgi:hypothetical protein
MENPQSSEPPEKKSKGFTLFAAKRIVIGTVGVLALLWGASYVLNLYESHDTPSAPHAPKVVADHDTRGEGHTAAETPPHGPASEDEHAGAAPHAAAPHDAGSHEQAGEHAAKTAGDDAHTEANGHDAAKPDAHTDDAGDHGAASKASYAAAGHAAAEDEDHAVTADDHAAEAAHGEADDAHGTPGEGHGDAGADAHGDGHGHGTIEISDVRGVTFVMATIAPMKHELEERFYGWRPNDIIRPADNVKNYQLGVLEVTRRTVEALTERISRTGSAQAFDHDLERARNNLMINASDYMLPSAESSYTEALEALERYRAKLENGAAPFYTRTVNLIPLLTAYENLLGSCDDNLVKAKEDDGRDVSWFRADDYFYYAEGVAHAMHTILQAVAVDFETVIESRRGTDVLHHAIEALHHATVIKPWIILDGAPDGFTANHRANLAAPISHARFYVGLLIQTLST